MQEIQLQKTNGLDSILFSKFHWYPNEIEFAKCLGFDVSEDLKQVTCIICRTDKRALFDFIRTCFKNYSESPLKEAERKQFYESVKVVYDKIYKEIEDNARFTIPYADMFYEHQWDTLKRAVYRKHNLLALDMGLGKAQPLSSKILTPNGWITMGEAKVGTEVINSEGETSVITGVFPQGIKDVYEITFSDGSKARCCKEHLWNVITPTQKFRGEQFKTLSLDQIINRGLSDKGGKLKSYIPIIKPVKFKEKSVLIDPYMMGLLLGDGCFRNNRISFSTPDEEIVDYFKKNIPDDCFIRKGDGYDYIICRIDSRKKHKIHSAVEYYGLMEKYSYEKSIPDDYKYNSVEIRTSILQGLMDTDGYCSKSDGTSQFYTTSITLAKDIMELISSLGGTSRITEKQGKYKKNGVDVICKICYTITINLPVELCPFKLTRKRDNYKTEKKYHPSRGIKKVELVCREECQCISVSAKDKLYVTDNYVLTHNTMTSASLSLLRQAEHTLILCPASVKWNWYRDLVKFGYNEIDFAILDRSKKRSMVSITNKFVVVNYEMIDKKKDFLLKIPFTHIIVDESTYIKNVSSGKFAATHFIVKQNPKACITLLTGTPIKNRIDDVYAYLKLTNHELGRNKKDFLFKYALMDRFRVVGAKNMNDLRMKISNFMIRKTKEECLDMPDKVFLSYQYELDDYRKEYDAAMAELAESGNHAAANGNIHSLNNVTAKAKVKGVINIAEEIMEADKKVVIFGSYKEPLNSLAKHFGDACIKIDGTVPAFERDAMLQRFYNDPNCKVFIGNIQAAGVGINLVNASDVIFINFPFTAAEFNQAIDRCFRIGQKNTVSVHCTFCEESLDKYIFDIIQQKDVDATAILDKDKESLGDANFSEILMKKLLKKDVKLSNRVNPILTETPNKDEIREVKEEVKSSTANVSDDLPDFL